MMASVESDAVTIELAALRHAENSPTSAQAVENCVPLISARPSFGPSTTGVRPALASASPPGRVLPSYVASPAPIMTAAMCASGARSPDAPTDPCDGTTGVTPLASMPSISSIRSQRTPDAPRPSDSNFNAIIKRVVAISSGSPTPQQWLRIRLRCRVSVSSGAILTEASLPKPVFTPYTASLPSAALRTMAFAASTSSRADGSSLTAT